MDDPRCAAPRSRLDCADCGVRTTTLSGAFCYLVHDRVWAMSGMDPDGGSLCIPCLEARLDRPLTWEDLMPHAAINEPGWGGHRDNPRLAWLKAELASHTRRC